MLTWKTQREKKRWLAKSGLYRSLGPMYMSGKGHFTSFSADDIGGLSSFLKQVRRVRTQYAKYPGGGESVSRGKTKSANARPSLTLTCHEQEVQKDRAFPVLYDDLVRPGHLGCVSCARGVLDLWGRHRSEDNGRGGGSGVDEGWFGRCRFSTRHRDDGGLRCGQRREKERLYLFFVPV